MAKCDKAVYLQFSREMLLARRQFEALHSHVMSAQTALEHLSTSFVEPVDQSPYDAGIEMASMFIRRFRMRSLAAGSDEWKYMCWLEDELSETVGGGSWLTADRGT